MLQEDELSMDLANIDVDLYKAVLGDNDPPDDFEDLKLSGCKSRSLKSFNNTIRNFDVVVLDNDNPELSCILDEYITAVNNDPSFNITQDPVFPTDQLGAILDAQMDAIAIVDNSHAEDDVFEQDFDYDLYEETVVEQNVNQGSEQSDSGDNKNPFQSIGDDMFVKEQPKPDQRARYDSDGPRFLPDAKKHPMSVQLPDLSSKLCEQNETYGIILTMVTTKDNPKRQTFVHVNGTKYRTDDAIELGFGRIFLPITEQERKNREKSFYRLSIICKKFDEYSFELTLFDPSNGKPTIEKYTHPDEDSMTQAAKGKQFVIDYDLLCYKMVFQLAFRRDDKTFISQIQCETNIINEQKAPTKGIKRKATSNTEIPKKKKSNMSLPIIYASEKSKSLLPLFAERSEIRRSNRLAKRSKGLPASSL